VSKENYQARCCPHAAVFGLKSSGWGIDRTQLKVGDSEKGSLKCIGRRKERNGRTQGLEAGGYEPAKLQNATGTSVGGKENNAQLKRGVLRCGSHGADAKRGGKGPKPILWKGKKEESEGPREGENPLRKRSAIIRGN